MPLQAKLTGETKQRFAVLSSTTLLAWYLVPIQIERRSRDLQRALGSPRQTKERVQTRFITARLITARYSGFVSDGERSRGASNETQSDVLLWVAAEEQGLLGSALYGA